MNNNINQLWNNIQNKIDDILYSKKKVFSSLKNVEFNDNPIFSRLESLNSHFLNYKSGNLTGEQFIIDYIHPVSINIDRKNNNCYISKYINDEDFLKKFDSLVYDLGYITKLIYNEFENSPTNKKSSEDEIEINKFPNKHYNLNDFYGKIID